MLSDTERLFLKKQRVGHLATADRDAAPHVVPVCFAICNDTLYVTIDAKPKRSLSTPLKRLKNIAQNPAVALVVDRYEEDWAQLGWVMLRGDAEILPSQKWSGLAMGIGLDRLAMLIKRIDDIRLLRSTDPRIAGQMLTLDRYEPVSNQPATHRDLSICVGDPNMELLGDRIRNVLGERSGWVENVELIQASDYTAVPEKARERLGMSPGHHNLLIRVTLRSLEGSISNEEANRVYDLLYSELHEGTAGYFRQ